MFTKVKNFFKKFDTFQKLFTFLGCTFGLLLSIGLLVGGVAAIPFTGGASMLPSGFGISLFIFLLTGGMGSAGKYIGLAVDTVIDKEKPTNEKLATLIGCVIGALLTILAFPLKFVGVGFIVEFMHIPLWEIALAFVPLTIGAFGSAASYIARVVDVIFNQRTILDWLFKPKPRNNQTTICDAIFKEEFRPPLRRTRSYPTLNIEAIKPSLKEIPPSQNIKIEKLKPLLIKTRFCPNTVVKNQLIRPLLRRARSCAFVPLHSTAFTHGIHAYLKMPRYNNSHLHWTSIYFDHDRGLNRALTYLQLYKAAQSELEKEVIAYSLLASLEGKTLQKVVFTNMGFTSLSSAQTFFKDKINSRMHAKQQAINPDITAEKEFLNRQVIAQIIKKANNNESVSSGAYTNVITSLRKLV